MGTQNIIMCFECEHTLVIIYKHIKKPNFNSTLKITKYLKKVGCFNSHFLGLRHEKHGHWMFPI